MSLRCTPTAFDLPMTNNFTQKKPLAMVSIMLAFFVSGASLASNLETDVQTSLPIVNRAYDYLHRNPELGKKESKAHDYLIGELRQFGYTQFISVQSAPTAVIAILDTGRPAPVIALRSEMDARPLPDGQNEPATHSPRSDIQGVMHNCGHDAHAAILLGTAAILVRNTDKLNGKIVLLFQPAEEIAGGADDIVNEHVLDQLGVQKIFAEHSAPGMPVGTVAISPGATLAGSTYFTLILDGRSSHAAAPFEGDDVLLSAAKIAEEISYAPARRFEIASQPVVISLTKFEADGGAANVLPATATLKGTIRAFEDPEVASPGRKSIIGTLLSLIDGLSKTYGLTYHWDLRAGPPPTINNPDLFMTTVRPLASTFPGTVDTTPYKGMFSEDFAYYTPHYQSLYFSLGIAKDGLGMAGVHTADFTIHPDAFKYGVTLMSLLAEIGTSDRADWQPVTEKNELQ
jgi:amidohydrolase